MPRPEDFEQQSQAPDGRPMSEQPKWRQDFPIDTAQDNYVSRRDFTKFMVLISGAFVVGQGWIGAHGWLRRRRTPPPEMAIASVDDIPVGAFKVFHYPDREQCLLLRPDEDTFVAYNQKCSHLHCPVRPVLDRDMLECPCHNGWFDLEGKPAGGPPRRPLPRITLEIRDGIIYATGVELRT